MNILLVEDDPYFAQRLRELLEDRGVDVVVAGSIHEAIVAFGDSIDAVISDIMLPNDPTKSGISELETRHGHLAGIALIRCLRKRRPNVPFILLSSVGAFGDAAIWAGKENIPIVSKEEGGAAVMSALDKVGLKGAVLPPRAFIVHGHDEAALAELKDYLQNTLKWAEPIVLREQASRGRTIIEKFEDFSERLDCVFVLITPDDSGVNLSTEDDKRRARQNVIFELGFFYAKMGRKSGRVIALRKGPCELPSDIQGIVWIDIEHGVKAAGENIRKEVEHISR